ncbi:MAG: hypothetical protein H6954_17585 [Chromatiaceae bacterium]|nr:hypothetical protein [Chromatiaceae bacterium]
MLTRTLILAILIAGAANPAAAYIGPGAGLGMLGSLIAVVIALLLGLVGLIILPIKLLRARKGKQRPSDDDRSPDA